MADLVEETARDSGFSPKRRLMARSSPRSPKGVEVPWALI